MISPRRSSFLNGFASPLTLISMLNRLNCWSYSRFCPGVKLSLIFPMMLVQICGSGSLPVS